MFSSSTHLKKKKIPSSTTASAKNVGENKAATYDKNDGAADSNYYDLKEGQVFGCVEYILGSSRNDTALAMEYVTVMVLPRTSVWGIVAGAPDLANDVQHLLAYQLDKEIPKEKSTGKAKGVFEGVQLKTQNNFLKKFRLKTKSKKDMVEGEVEALGSDHKVASLIIESPDVKKVREKALSANIIAKSPKLNPTQEGDSKEKGSHNI